MDQNTSSTTAKQRNYGKMSNNNLEKLNGIDNPKANKKPDNLSEKTSLAVYMIFISLLLDLLAFTLILPLFPSLMEHYKLYDSIGLYSWFSNNIKTFQEFVGAPERYNSVLFGGVLGSMFSFLQFVVSPVVGGLSDVYGRKPIMQICLGGIAFSYVLWALSSNFALFILARFIGGISKGNVSLSMAVITDVSSGKGRTKGMALVGIAFSLGFTIGPVIGALFTTFTDKTNADWFIYPALFALFLATADLIFVTICFKETLPKEHRSKAMITSLSQAVSLISIPQLFGFTAVQNLSDKNRNGLKRLGQVYFIYLFLYSGLEFTLTFLTHHTFGYNSMQQGKMFFFIGITMAVFQGGFVRRIPEHKLKSAATGGLWLIVPAYILVAFSPIASIYLLYMGLFLFAVSTAFVVPSLLTLASRFGGVEQKGTVMGVFRSLGALSRAIGPVVASIAFWCIGCTPTYLCGGILLVIPVLMLQLSNI